MRTRTRKPPVPGHHVVSSNRQRQSTIGHPGAQRLRAAVSRTVASEQEAEGVADRVMQTRASAGTREHTRGSSCAIARSGQLSSEERSFFERRFGRDFSQVRIHADMRSAATAEALGAEAFTLGRDIYLGAGTPRRGTRESNRLLAHELSHVVQQSQTGLALQPKLKITGKAADVSRAMALLNANLDTFYYVSVDKSGEVKLDPVRAAHTSSLTGPKAEAKALAERLWTVTNDAKEVAMTVSAGTKTLGGSYATGDFDIADLETYGVAGLIHEIEEQYQKQVKGLAFGSDTSGAHAEAIKAESEVRGAKRGAQKTISSTANADGTRDAVVEIPHTFPDGTVKTMVMTIKSNNIESVTWK